MEYLAVKAAVKQADQKMGTAKKALAMMRDKAKEMQARSGRKDKAA